MIRIILDIMKYDTLSTRREIVETLVFETNNKEDWKSELYEYLEYVIEPKMNAFDYRYEYEETPHFETILEVCEVEPEDLFDSISYVCSWGRILNQFRRIEDESETDG